MSVWLDEKTKKYRAKFMLDGKTYWKKGFKTKQAAKDWEADERKKIKNPPPPMIDIISFVTLSDRYLDHCQARMQKNTWRAKAHYYSKLLEFMNGDFPAEELTKIQALDFLEQTLRKEGSKVANRHLKDLKALYGWGFLNDLVKTNPCKTIEPFPEAKSVKYVPPAEDIDKCLMAASQEDMDLLVCLYHTGGRIGEILRLSWEDVNLEKRSIILWTRKRRGGQLEPDKLSMAESLHSLLVRRWQNRNKESQFVFCKQNGQCFSYQSKRNLMADLCERAKVKPFGFHAIRHHVASILADSGKATLTQIQRFLRHRRPSTTENYLHEVSRDLVEVAGILDEKKGHQSGHQTKSEVAPEGTK
jgi:site-specific recombinase XerD